MLCLSTISMMFVKKKYVGSVYVGGYGGLSESGHCVFRDLCPVGFRVVYKCSSFCCSLYSCRMLIVVMMGKWSDDSAC